MNLKAKDISEALLSSLIHVLDSEGFRKYKSNQFIKISDDTILFCQLFSHKNDVRLWCASYPLCQNNIWFGVAYISKRFPEKEGILKVSDLESLETIKDYFGSIEQKLIEYFKTISSLDSLVANIHMESKGFNQLVRGFCLSAIGRNSEAKICIQKFLDSGLDLGETRNGAKELLKAIDNGSQNELFERNRQENIKKLRLKKFL